MKRFPRILFVNEYPPESLLVADLVRQLLVGYPPECIEWWHWRTGTVRELSDLRVNGLHHWRLPDRVIPNRRFAGLKSALMEHVFVPQAARHLRRTIEEVKPDVVWVLLFGWPILVAKKALLKEQARLHVSLWDMPDTVNWRKTLGGSRTDRFVRATYQLVQRAESSDGISSAVLEEIASKTGRKDALLVHSGFEPHQLNALETQPPSVADDVLRLAYVGTIISENAFAEVLAALDKVRSRVSRKVVLEFFGARNYRSRPWFNSDWMIEHGVFSDQGLVESLRRCAWGIVVMDTEGADLQYSRFSFPNKVGTYLSAGIPVLGVGHEQSTLAAVLRQHPVGRFTNATKRDVLEKFMDDCLKTSDPRAEFRLAIIECAKTEFNAQSIRQRLWKTWGAVD